MVHAILKIKSTINGSINIKKNYSPVGKSLVGEGARKEDVYEQYLGVSGELNIPIDVVSEEIKH